ncbi:hypothetical protein H1C71_017847, partial [Ictidomys tridecemlineatus]
DGYFAASLREEAVGVGLPPVPLEGSSRPWVSPCLVGPSCSEDPASWTEQLLVSVALQFAGIGSRISCVSDYHIFHDLHTAADKICLKIQLENLCFFTGVSVLSATCHGSFTLPLPNILGFLSYPVSLEFWHYLSRIKL